MESLPCMSFAILSEYGNVKNDQPPIAINRVHLLGRVSSLAVSKQMPSGDLVVEFRLVVDRKSKRAVKREVDTLHITAWLARPQKRALSLKINDWVEVEGSIRRRFWKSPTGLASRWQVEASQLKKI
jgi:single-strand DNA-binding protein